MDSPLWRSGLLCLIFIHDDKGISHMTWECYPQTLKPLQHLTISQWYPFHNLPSILAAKTPLTIVAEELSREKVRVDTNIPVDMELGLQMSTASTGATRAGVLAQRRHPDAGVYGKKVHFSGRNGLRRLAASRLPSPASSMACSPARRSLVICKAREAVDEGLCIFSSRSLAAQSSSRYAEGSESCSLAVTSLPWKIGGFQELR